MPGRLQTGTAPWTNPGPAVTAGTFFGPLNKKIHKHVLIKTGFKFVQVNGLVTWLGSSSSPGINKERKKKKVLKNKLATKMKGGVY